jgi:hypothetical protein
MASALVGGIGAVSPAATGEFTSPPCKGEMIVHFETCMQLVFMYWVVYNFPVFRFHADELLVLCCFGMLFVHACGG